MNSAPHLFARSCLSSRVCVWSLPRMLSDDFIMLRTARALLSCSLTARCKLLTPKANLVAATVPFPTFSMVRGLPVHKSVEERGGVAHALCKEQLDGCAGKLHQSQTDPHHFVCYQPIARHFCPWSARGSSAAMGLSILSLLIFPPHS